MPTMLLVTHGTDGDVLPFVRLGGELRAGGHEVTLITHAHYGPHAARAGLGFVPIDTATEFERTLADTHDLLDGLGWREFYERNGLYRQMELEFTAMAARYRAGETVLVGRHTSALSVLFAAEALGAPAAWVAVAPIQIMAERAALHAYRTLLDDGIGGVRRRLGLRPIEDWDAWFSSADLHIGLWPAWFDRAGTQSPGKVRLTGFPLPDENAEEALPPEAEEALSGPVAPVLVTGGTGRMLHRRFYDAAVEGARKAGRPVMLVVRHRDLVPDPLPPDMTWFPRLPFRAVMPRVAAVVHHGGIGTLSRALRAGVPQIILAHGVDRPDNAARLHRHHLAAWLPAPRWTPEEVAALVTSATGGDPLAAVPAGDAPGQDEGTQDGVRRAAELIAPLAVAPPDFPDEPGPAVQAARRQLERMSAAQRRAVAERLRGRLSGQEA
ncbi:glycosyltransferase [Sphaerisporangium rubeum]|uniref:UDP:flavonoid glycosyltransferase YjiC (YdhE family) n=1 Tax=Sphaerisporangium rubeum TaxID=321317 RepID=A0A7X0M8T2_9ACTN|nr:glycosyltransferase [Sphaerisporangium rubeum]MBB6474216.1 UDP:flavonoid glycosyltransferase YjiC (YdhE family) [Sphaerisporangium rubeum]